MRFASISSVEEIMEEEEEDETVVEEIMHAPSGAGSNVNSPKRITSIFDKKVTQSIWENRMLHSVVSALIWPLLVLLCSLITALIITSFRFWKMTKRRVLRRLSTGVADHHGKGRCI